MKKKLEANLQTVARKSVQCIFDPATRISELVEVENETGVSEYLVIPLRHEVLNGQSALSIDIEVEVASDMPCSLAPRLVVDYKDKGSPSGRRININSFECISKATTLYVDTGSKRVATIHTEITLPSYTDLSFSAYSDIWGSSDTDDLSSKSRIADAQLCIDIVPLDDPKILFSPIVGIDSFSDTDRVLSCTVKLLSITK